MSAPAVATGYGGRLTVDLGALKRNWPALDKVSKGALTGAVGETCETKAFLQRFEGFSPSLKAVGFIRALSCGWRFDQAAAIVIPKLGAPVFRFEGDAAWPLEERSIAIGAGCEAALGALDARASAPMAVAIAIHRVTGLGYPIEVIRHDGDYWRLGSLDEVKAWENAIVGEAILNRPWPGGYAITRDNDGEAA